MRYAGIRELLIGKFMSPSEARVKPVRTQMMGNDINAIFLEVILVANQYMVGISKLYCR